MPTFLMTAKKDIGTGNNKLTKGAFIQVFSGSSCMPSSSLIREAIKNQLNLDIKAVSHTQFNVVKK